MTTQIDVAANMLYPSEGTQAANIKYFRGRLRPALAERLAQQFVQAEKQIRTGATNAIDNIDD